MRQAWRALHAAGRLRHRFAGTAGYGLAYGSHPAGTASETSDLDLVLITAERLPAGRLHALADAVCQLHHDHGLALDTEVDYAVKVHATCGDVVAATSLRCFTVGDAGRIEVPPVVVEPWFLNSAPFRLRLLLNALTSPHAFLGGHVTLYHRHRRRAEYALGLLALSLHHGEVLSLDDAIAVVTEHAEGARGEDFLGYTPGPHLYGVLNQGLSYLAANGVVRDLDGIRFSGDAATIRAAVAQLRDLPMAERGPANTPGTIAVDD
jgi:arginyl-tRNA synthetase